jgi:cytoskeletal protein RodZ
MARIKEVNMRKDKLKKMLPLVIVLLVLLGLIVFVGMKITQSVDNGSNTPEQQSAEVSEVSAEPEPTVAPLPDTSNVDEVAKTFVTDLFTWGKLIQVSYEYDKDPAKFPPCTSGYCDKPDEQAHITKTTKTVTHEVKPATALDDALQLVTSDGAARVKLRALLDNVNQWSDGYPNYFSRLPQFTEVEDGVEISQPSRTADSSEVTVNVNFTIKETTPVSDKQNVQEFKCVLTLTLDYVGSEWKVVDWADSPNTKTKVPQGFYPGVEVF